MTDIPSLIAALRAWGPMVSSGYECPAAGTKMHEAADALERLTTPGDLVLETTAADRIAPATDTGDGWLGVNDAWQDLCEKEDRTSPADHPEMCLITAGEFAGYLNAAARSQDATIADLERRLAEVSTSRQPYLGNVIEWLENGCDPKMAVLELRAIQTRISAALSPDPAGNADGEGGT